MTKPQSKLIRAYFSHGEGGGREGCIIGGAQWLLSKTHWKLLLCQFSDTFKGVWPLIPGNPDHAPVLYCLMGSRLKS